MSDSAIDRQATIDASLAAWNRGEFSGLEAHVAPHFVRRSPPAFDSNAGSLEEFKTLVQDFRAQFPDASVTVGDVIEAGDRATIAWTFTGTNTGPGDFPPTGRSVEVSGVSVNRWEGGKLVEELVFFDTLSFMSQLGVVELPG